jgi:hypothetical protein
MAKVPLLDNSLIYFGSGMSNGNLHDRATPPALLVGGARGKLKGNRHIAAKKEPTANLLLSIANLYGAQIDKFGASTGPSGDLATVFEAKEAAEQAASFFAFNAIATSTPQCFSASRSSVTFMTAIPCSII